jgi:hypothetical protein
VRERAGKADASGFGNGDGTLYLGDLVATGFLDPHRGHRLLRRRNLLPDDAVGFELSCLEDRPRLPLGGSVVLRPEITKSKRLRRILRTANDRRASVLRTEPRARRTRRQAQWR